MLSGLAARMQARKSGEARAAGYKELSTSTHQSSPSRSSRSRSAYAVMRSIHCRIGLRMTGCPPRSLKPSMTCKSRGVSSAWATWLRAVALPAASLQARASSLASTVPSAGHQLTATSACSAELHVSPRQSAIAERGGSGSPDTPNHAQTSAGKSTAVTTTSRQYEHDIPTLNTRGTCLRPAIIRRIAGRNLAVPVV